MKETKELILEDFTKTGTISQSDRIKIKEGARIIRQGGLCAFPTETVYGLGGNALMKEASRHIYEAKGRPSDNPLIVHIAELKDIDPLVSEMPEKARLLAEKFWPGPMTMIFRKSALVPYETTGGLDTVAVRFPSHPVAMELIKEAGVPVAAPSANLSGRPSTTSGKHCREDLNGRVDAIIDGGSSDIGLESTIVDVTGEEPQLLRPGAITKEMLEAALREEVIEDVALKGPLSEGEKPKAPGMKYRHYAPKAPMVLVTAKDKAGVSRISGRILELIREKRENFGDAVLSGAVNADITIDSAAESTAETGGSTVRIALLCSVECVEEIRGILEAEEKSEKNALLSDIDIKITGSRDNKAEIAHGLFEYLREFDADGADYIIAEGYSEEALGLAIMNRLKKAAAWQLIYV